MYDIHFIIIHHHHHHHHSDHLQCPEQADRQVMSTGGEELHTELLTRLHLVTYHYILYYHRLPMKYIMYDVASFMK